MSIPLIVSQTKDSIDDQKWLSSAAMSRARGVISSETNVNILTSIKDFFQKTKIYHLL